MSLDVYLTVPETVPNGSGIFIRENGQQRELTRAEWDAKFPGIEPVVAVTNDDNHCVYSANITHNLNEMAEAAGIYTVLWRPEEALITTAAQLISPLRQGLDLLRTEPEHFKKYNAPNGWGVYTHLVRFVEEYLAACEQYPHAIVSVSR